jgi:integrase
MRRSIGPRATFKPRPLFAEAKSARVVPPAARTCPSRLMPVHPTLAAILGAWKATGWEEMMGRAPTPDDLVVPLPEPTNRGRRVQEGAMRTDHNSYKRLLVDLATLGLRHRRGHDLRRTLISLARMDGARGDILELCTHNPGNSGHAIDLYTTFSCEARCTELLKLSLAQ